MPYKAKIAGDLSWNDIPSCKQSGVDVDYLMLRGIFMAGGMTDAQRIYYIELMKKVRETADWKEFTERGAFNTTALSDDEYKAWLRT
ncbi:MAG: hypothetical protein ABIU95_10410 [Burkholderiales bacterium]